jgi:ATP adenylyltransferase
MQKLWSPWRSQYIESFNTNQKPGECIFCSLKDPDINDNSNLVVNKGRCTYSVLNLYPYNNGHLIIVPFRHIDKLDLLTDEENLDLMKELQLASQILSKTLNAQGFNIGANLGRISGAGIDEHIHFHIVPRWNGDTNFMPVLGEVKVISQDLLSTKIKLIEAYSGLKTKL